MSLRCALTGVVAAVPVLNIKNGRVYDQHAINQHLSINSNDPITNQPVNVATDLVPISLDSLMIPPVQSLNPSYSLRDALQTINREFDGLMLEQFQLKKENLSVKQELATALYQQDAAARVIARLIKERDQLKQQLDDFVVNQSTTQSNNQSNNQSQSSKLSNNDQMEVDAESQSTTQSTDQSILNHIIVDSVDQLSKKRKAAIKHLKSIKQSNESISQMKLVSSVTLGTDVSSHCMDVDYQSVSQSMPLGLVVSGNSDGSIQLIDCSNQSVVETLKPTTKRITDITFVHPPQFSINQLANQSTNEWTPLSTAPRLPFLAASSDGSTSLYCVSQSSPAKYQSVYRTANHSGAVSLSVHPSSLMYLTAGLDGRWHINEMQTGKSINHFLPDDHNQSVGFSCARFHPDGRIIGVAATDFTFKVFDASSADAVGSFKGHTAAPLSLAFSPHGLHAVTGDADNVVKLWDLRYVSPDASKPLNFHNIQCDQPVRSVTFDESASHLIVASGQRCLVYDTKTWQQVWTNQDINQSSSQSNGHEQNEITSLRVSPRFDMLHTANSAGIVKVYQTQQAV